MAEIPGTATTEAPAPPALRQDLAVARQETPEGVWYAVKDGRTGRFFKLREQEWAVARRLDGATPLDAVARGVSAELGVDAEPDVVRVFVEQLQRRGLLADGGASPSGLPDRQRWIHGNVLWLRFKAFDPDKLLDRLIGYVRFCFTPHFLVSSGALVLWAMVTVATSRAEIGADLSRLWRVESLFLVWLTIMAVTAAHEFAHGLTCKHFGGHVHEMGFLLIYLQPAFYCNISDAWLFPQKRHRLWVTFAGAYLELILWGVATLVWRITEPGTWPSAIALIVMATSGVKAFFNLNPLIKLDGYYLLSDMLDVPNLRQRAFGYVGARIKRLLGSPVVDALEVTPRERRIFVAYGLLAAVFSYWLLTQVLLWLATSLTASYQGWGFLAFAGLLGAVVQSILGKPLFRVPTFLKGRRTRLLALAGAVLVVLFLAPLQLKISGEVELLPARNADVRADAEGIIEQVYVDEGARVVAGQPIARLSDREYQVRHRMVEAEIRERQARLRLLQAGPRRQEVAVVRLAVEKADERLRYAEAELERLRALEQSQAASRTELEQAQERVAVLAKERDEANARLDVLRAGSRPEEIAAVEQEIARFEAERSRLVEQLARVTVTAPHGGVITTPKLHEKVGEYVRPGDLIAEVHALETVMAEIAVSERDVGEVRLGQRGVLRLRAYADRTFEGPVTAIAPAAVVDAARGERIVRVTIALPNSEGLLKPQMTGYAQIHTGQRRALDVLTRRARRFVRVEFWSWW